MLIPMSRSAAHRPTWTSSVGWSFPFHPVTGRILSGQTPTATAHAPVQLVGNKHRAERAAYSFTLAQPVVVGLWRWSLPFPSGWQLAGSSGE